MPGAAQHGVDGPPGMPRGGNCGPPPRVPQVTPKGEPQEVRV